LSRGFWGNDSNSLLLWINEGRSLNSKKFGMNPALIKAVSPELVVFSKQRSAGQREDQEKKEKAESFNHIKECL
jgi:hypothetical protein